LCSVWFVVCTCMLISMHDNRMFLFIIFTFSSRGVR
jgi:hypothetical protein